ncbi:hypothetical protein SARC_00700 [Sphaeroforma arctica JP610]|uniref:Uncharacterized protein n=1 Tax=Sphaeroforma arctica JP610 TaxID=667725 RepID=A0A0L0GDT1_9EUKA|nr:hypothetical protein SARC_00700 [Sphaeroforma arctica JP610]KNC87172.1 hypothetical protein SARC_00700 [Sphaeroforma arctica JP610]|eukprot:XP_014161074.1 hypothetical protein SARC_00700 [Sphaeroforma arctica JP610]
MIDSPVSGHESKRYDVSKTVYDVSRMLFVDGCTPPRPSRRLLGLFDATWQGVVKESGEFERGIDGKIVWCCKTRFMVRGRIGKSKLAV